MDAACMYKNGRRDDFSISKVLSPTITIPKYPMKIEKSDGATSNSVSNMIRALLFIYT